MKIAVYSPYLDTAGGGEKYMMTIASVLSEKCQVDVLLDSHLDSIGATTILNKINDLHGIDLNKVNFIRAPIGRGGNFLKRLQFLINYDWLFYLTDGSIFFSTAKKSIIHFQVPFSASPKTYWDKIKLSSWSKAIFNSKFTRSIIEPNWKIKGEVIYPPVNINLFKMLSKKNQIVSVGRFFGFLKDKKHEFLIESFKRLVDENKLSDWSLHLVGGAGGGDLEYVQDLMRQSKGYKINFYPNASLDEAKRIYGHSSIYWHASGFGETEPEKFEHFGITIVEAMASGCVPVVINKGGPREILQDSGCGLLWDTQDELIDKTLHLIKNSQEVNSISKKGINKARQYSQEVFAGKIERLVYGA